MNTYIAAQRYTRLAHSLPAGSGTTVAESLRPGTRFELRETAQPARFWGVTVLENVGGGGASGLLGLGYDSPDLKPRSADLRQGCSPNCPQNEKSNVADPDPGRGAFLTPRSGMGKKSGSGSGIRIRDPDPG